ncbi:hypothetical protein TSAR_008446, partial [Trichomalopsis sarcophagae]
SRSQLSRTDVSSLLIYPSVKGWSEVGRRNAAPKMKSNINGIRKSKQSNVRQSSELPCTPPKSARNNSYAGFLDPRRSVTTYRWLNHIAKMKSVPTARNKPQDA